MLPAVCVYRTPYCHGTCSGSDGLVKLWNIRTNECVVTLDQHTEKVTIHFPEHLWCEPLCVLLQVWSLACSSDGMVLVSGSADSVICEWKASHFFTAMGRHVCCYSNHVLLH